MHAETPRALVEAAVAVILPKNHSILENPLEITEAISILALIIINWTMRIIIIYFS